MIIASAWLCVAALVADGSTTLIDPEELTESYPAFLETLRGLGGVVDTKFRGDEATSIAYSSNRMEPHTDGSFMAATPGIIVLKCLTPDTGAGGRSVLVDGYRLVLRSGIESTASTRREANRPH